MTSSWAVKVSRSTAAWDSRGSVMTASHSSAPRLAMRSPTGTARWAPWPGWQTRCGRGRCCGSRSPKTPARAWTPSGSATPRSWAVSGSMSAKGDTMVCEMRVRTLMAADVDTLAAELDTVFGNGVGRSAGALPRRRGRRRGQLAEPRRGVVRDVQSLRTISRPSIQVDQPRYRTCWLPNQDVTWAMLVYGGRAPDLTSLSRTSTMPSPRL